MSDPCHVQRLVSQDLLNGLSHEHTFLTKLHVDSRERDYTLMSTSLH